MSMCLCVYVGGRDGGLDTVAHSAYNVPLILGSVTSILIPAIIIHTSKLVIHVPSPHISYSYSLFGIISIIM